MQTTQRNLFTTISTEGALLPSDLLGRISDGAQGIEGLTPETYHLAKGEKLNEATSRAWNRLLGHWASFRGALDAAQAGETHTLTSETRERWLLPLFNELDYGRLLTARAQELDGKTYPISHMWGNVPIHLVGAGVDLDRKTAGVVGAARTSPHSLLQEFLNASSDNLWGFVSNGLRLRILRDNSSLTRQAYVEFDLQGMMDGEVYSDFVLLWLLCHQSRVESEKPEECWLERLSKNAAEQGTRALDQLRGGVEASISALGRGFLAHPSNRALREKLRSGELEAQEYYRQLLRMVYRLIFLFVAEDRDLLLSPDATPEARRRYTEFYATARLRRLAIKQRGTRHSDLFHSLRLVMKILGDDQGCPQLGLPALDSFLFEQGGKGAMSDLERAEITNGDLLDAVRELSYTLANNMRRPVDYRNMGAEELGSVYEALLELHPQLNLDAGTFSLTTAGGNERKTTGSYYTPTSLITSLLDSALDPVLDEAARKPTGEAAEAAILDLKVCDPACGSGHFLIAAAHRIAKRLARVRTGDDEPAPDTIRRALRDVIGRCIYGVDLNPMAVELCKVSLWMEALEPGKPLSFLDAHIKVGNSLLGATPALIAGGIPDEAFEPIEGDEKAVCSEYKKRNREARKGQQSFLDDVMPWERLGNFAAGMAGLDEIDDSTLEGVRLKQQRYADLVNSSDYVYNHLLADAWCAAFVWKKTKEFAYPIWEQVFRRIERNPFDVAVWMRDEIVRLREQHGFFHPHLEFPTVFRMPAGDEHATSEQAGWSGGFDVVLGNPPWERIKLQEQEWFAARRPDIANAANAAARKRMIAALSIEDPALYAAFREDLRQAEGESHLVRHSGRYPLNGRGDVNTYAVFAEVMRSLLSPTGRIGVIVPSGIATDDTTKFFFQDLMDTRTLVSLYDFENREGIFQGVHRSYKFCLLTMSGEGRPAKKGAEFVFFALNTGHLNEEERQFTLTREEIALLNPNTRTCPIFRSKRDAELTKAIYRQVPVLIKEGQYEVNPWGIRFATMFHMSNDSHLFRTREQLEREGWRLEGNLFRRGSETYLPLYEAKMIHHFTHRWATYSGFDTRDTTPAELADPSFVVLPRYWVPVGEVLARLAGKWDKRWLLGFREICRSTDERTTIAGMLPAFGVGHKFLLALPSAEVGQLVGFYGSLVAFAFDYVARQKVGGTSMAFFIFKQLPILAPLTYLQPVPWQQGHTLRDWMSPRVLELTYTAYDLEPFARDCGYNGPPFRWDEERRFILRCELDAAYFHLYGIARDDVDYIMETFPIVKRKDEAQHGEYRTKRVILEIYDAMQRAIEGGEEYKTLLDPPPADPRAAHPPTPGDPPPSWHTLAPPLPSPEQPSQAVREPNVTYAPPAAAPQEHATLNREVVGPNGLQSARISVDEDVVVAPSREQLAADRKDDGAAGAASGQADQGRAVVAGKAGKTPNQVPSKPVEPLGRPAPTSSAMGGVAIRRSATPGSSTPYSPYQQSFLDPPSVPVFRVGERVKHPTFGEGQVMLVQPAGKDQILTVAFKSAGTKRLMASVARLERM